MTFGVCITPDRLSQINHENFDFVEYPLALITSLGEDEYRECKNSVKESGLRFEAFNLFIPSDMALVGENADINRLSEHIKNSLARAAELGGQTVIFGSAKARQVYCEQDKSKIVKIARMMADEAKQYGITVIAEPLNANETNFINTVREGCEFAKQVDRDNFKTMVDFFHFLKMNETAEDLISAREVIAHVHIANPQRCVPEESEIEQLKSWSQMLNKIGYNGRISIEAKYKDFDKEMLRTSKIFEVFRQQ